MRILIITFFCLYSSFAYAADQAVKIYSAYELQKIGEGVYKSLNTRNIEDAGAELIQTQSKPDHNASLQQIEKAMLSDTSDDIRRIYQAVAMTTKEKDTTSASSVEDKTDDVPPPIVKSVIETQDAKVVETDLRRPNQRIETWLRRQSENSPSELQMDADTP